MSALYAFSEHIFTNAGATGRTGPILSTVRTAYSSATWAQDTTNNWLNMTSDNGIQLWTVPKTGRYTIKAAGAGGNGGTTSNAGRGYIITSTHTLTKGQIIKILVGQVGTNTYGKGGGGGTFIATNTNTPLVVCGGGGGINLYNNSPPQDAIGTGGSDTAGADGDGGSTGGCGMNGSGGASFTYNSNYAKSFLNGGVGGPMPDLGCVTISYGGFGGGGGGGNGGGGGGGYTGGKGGDNISPYYSGSGGGSYSSTTVTSTDYNIVGAEGYVTVTYISPIITAADYESTFTSHTFTNAGATGRTGPILSAVRTAYSSAVWAQDTTNNWLNMTSDNGIQLWTVPKTGRYMIDAYGGGTPCGGAGGRILGNFNLTKGSILSIVCGQVSTVSTWSSGGWFAEGGGGGTYVCVGDRIKSNMLCVAGGGGGSTNNDSANLRSDGTKYGGWSVSALGDSDTGGAVLGGNGSGSGAGVSGDGVLQNPQPGTQTAKCFANASMGGYNINYPMGVGGFGGGGNGGGQPGGGGGGFRGGNTGYYDIGGQGGTSYILASATNAVNITGGGGAYQPGKVIITLILTSPATLSFTKNVYYQKYVVNSTFSIPSSSILTSNTDTSFSVTHSSGNTGIVTVTNSANTGTVTVKGLGTVQLTSIIAATANFTETTVALITVVIVGAGTTYANIALNSIDLSGTDLGGTIFSSCDLTSANLYGTTISNSTDLSTVTSMTSLRSGRIIGFTTLLPTGYKMI